MKTKLFIALILSFTLNTLAEAQNLQQKIESIVAGKQAEVGVVVRNLDTGETLGIDLDKRFPMQSVFKFHLALHVLNEVDKGNLDLNDMIVLQPSDLLEDTWSPMRDAYKAGERINIVTLLDLSVKRSDNNACDVLLRQTGGAVALNNYIHALGIDSVQIVFDEATMHQAWDNQYKNYTTPRAMADLLTLFAEHKVLANNTRFYLWNAMSNLATGSGRLRKYLPEEALLVNKTGTSGFNEKGVAGATNDAGIIVMPNDGPLVVVAVFVKDSTEPNEVNEEVIAQIAREVYNHYAEE